MRLRFFGVLLTFVSMLCLAGAQTTTQPKPAVSKDAIELIKAKDVKATRMNELIVKANRAIEARNWQQVEELTQKLIAEDPARWRFYQPLGTAQLNLGEYAEAIKTYDKALDLVSREAGPSLPDQSKARTAAISTMLTSQGNGYLKLKRTTEAIASYTKAAALSPNPGLAYFNLCATQYNTGNTNGALDACEKAIAADPQRADAYFIKGSLLIANSTTSKDGRVHAAPGTVEALRKYLELKPDGPHASDAKAMLEYIGEK